MSAASESHDIDPKSQADGPTDPGVQGWWHALEATWTESGKDNLSLVASGIAFNGFLALIPLLTAVVLGYGLVVSPEQVVRHIEILAKALPQDAANLIGQQLTGMVQSSGAATGFGLLVTLFIAVYGAMRGATGMIVGLNIVYNVKEARPLLWQMLTALAITIGAVMLFLIASVAISLINNLEGLLPNLGGLTKRLLQLGFWAAAASVVSLVISAIYAYAPNRKQRRWRWLTPGVVGATIGWIIATLGFSFYVSNFANYNAAYGGLGAVIVFLTWLYLSAYIVLFGAELNQVIHRRARHRGLIGTA